MNADILLKRTKRYLFSMKSFFKYYDNSYKKLMSRYHTLLLSLRF